MGPEMDPKDVIIKYLEGRIGTLQSIIENLKSWIYQRIDEAIPDDILNGTATTTTITITRTRTRTKTTALDIKRPIDNFKECQVILKRLPQYVLQQYLSQQNQMISVDAESRPMNIFEHTRSSRSHQVSFQNHNGDEDETHEDYFGDQDQIYDDGSDEDQECKSKSKPFKCSYTNCAKEFKMRETLLIHISQKHEEKMKIEIRCPHCEKIFYHRRALYWHSRAVHKIKSLDLMQMPLDKTDNSNDSDATVDETEQLIPQAEISDEINQVGVKLEVDNCSTPHSDENSLACRYCLKTFKFPTSTKIHESIHERQQEYKCDYPNCEKIFYHSKYLYWHKRRSHTFLQRRILKRDKGYIPDMKNESQDDFFSIRKDTSTLVPTVFFKCELGDCSKEYKNIEGIRIHKAQVHDQKNEILCSLCPRIFFHPRALNWHTRYAHSHQEKPKSKSTTIDVGSCICETCGRSFKKSEYLKNHIKNIHSQGDLHGKKSLKSKSKLKLPSKINRYFEEPKLCAICGKTFSIVSNYTNHMRAHKYQEKYKCDICSKGFVSGVHLKIHRLTHYPPTKECKLCNKLLTTDASLQVHMKSVHSIGLPFECLVCSRKFKVKRQLVVHQKRLKH